MPMTEETLHEALRSFSSNKEPSVAGVNVAVVGPKGAGKDTLGNILQKYAKFEHLNFADLLKEVCFQKYGLTYEECYEPALKEKVLTRWPHVTPRQIMQDEAESSRKLYPDIWVKAWEDKISWSVDSDQNLLVTDLRYPNELETFRKLQNNVVIYVMNPAVEEERRQGIARLDPRWMHESESHAPMLRNFANLLVVNKDLTQTSLESSLAYSLHIL